jgi:hypothetical protein
LLERDNEFGAVDAVSDIFGVSEDGFGVFGWVEVGGIGGGVVDEE